MIVIATDSSACMTKQGARELGVIYIPMTYTLCGKTYTESFIGANGDFVPLLEAEPDPCLLYTSHKAIHRQSTRPPHAGVRAHLAGNPRKRLLYQA